MKGGSHSSYLQAKEVLGEQSMEGNLLPKNPRAMKTEPVTNLFWHNYKLLIHFFDTILLHQLCNGVKVLVF